MSEGKESGSLKRRRRKWEAQSGSQRAVAFLSLCVNGDCGGAERAHGEERSLENSGEAAAPLTQVAGPSSHFHHLYHSSSRLQVSHKHWNYRGFTATPLALDFICRSCAGVAEGGSYFPPPTNTIVDGGVACVCARYAVSTLKWAKVDWGVE